MTSADLRLAHRKNGNRKLSFRARLGAAQERQDRVVCRHRHLLTIGDGEPGAQVYSHALDGAGLDPVRQGRAHGGAVGAAVEGLRGHQDRAVLSEAMMAGFRAAVGRGLRQARAVAARQHRRRGARLEGRQAAHVSDPGHGRAAPAARHDDLDRRRDQDLRPRALREFPAIFRRSDARRADLRSSIQANKDDDWTDPKVWAKANPNLGVSLKRDFLEAECKRALQTPRLENDFKRYHLNIWVEQAKRWFPMHKWADNTAHPKNKDYWKKLDAARRCGPACACARRTSASCRAFSTGAVKGRRQGARGRSSALSLVRDRRIRAMTALEFKQMMQAQLDLRGNAYALKEFDGRGGVVALWPVQSDHVTVLLAGRRLDRVFYRSDAAARSITVPGGGMCFICAASRSTASSACRRSPITARPSALRSRPRNTARRSSATARSRGRAQVPTRARQAAADALRASGSSQVQGRRERQASSRSSTAAWSGSRPAWTTPMRSISRRAIPEPAKSTACIACRRTRSAISSARPTTTSSSRRWNTSPTA
jgi:hypothetical protein